MNLSKLATLFLHNGCRSLYAKVLAENDNSKNQVYFGPDFQALNLFPNRGITADRKDILKAGVDFSWLLPNGNLAESPFAQLILYPQYPEVRFSGFLRGCPVPPSDLMTRRLRGRVLFLGVTSKDMTIGFVAAPESEIALEFQKRSAPAGRGVFVELDLQGIAKDADSKSLLLKELTRINRLGWIASKQLSQDGTIGPCTAPQCGGFTLEAELGIPKNSRAEPDYLGWEVKQYAVASFDRSESGIVTLMTPEPNGGLYKEAGPEQFVRIFGYSDKCGRPDRMNFGGIHKAMNRHRTTLLTLQLKGFVSQAGRFDPQGKVALVSDSGLEAATWSFIGLLDHWTKKHSKAVYVPSQCRKTPNWEYCYGNRVRLASKTDFVRFLQALSDGIIYYDPGIKLEGVSSGKPRVKRRSQFRINMRYVHRLYDMVETVEL